MTYFEKFKQAETPEELAKMITDIVTCDYCDDTICSSDSCNRALINYLNKEIEDEID